ncbi:hypothetical protein [Klebsiella pneumoniae]|uniref:hypothetical protein n=1 Tax=Klebsiella pneumoniae TaxID=573 RepID=UPI001E552DAA|nr:hypothetical protein [Klebsiella pneumoniae]
MEQLLSDYKKGNVILFVGAGVSMNLGLPSWSQLVDHIATELGYDPDIYRTFGSALELAEYYKLKKGKIGPLRSWMDRMWHSREVAIKWSAAPDMTPQTVLYRRPVAQFSNFQPKIVSSWLILALFQANFLISGRSRLCPYQLVNSNQVRQGE